MADQIMQCPECKQTISVPRTAGKSFCPFCGKPIVILNNGGGSLFDDLKNHFPAMPTALSGRDIGFLVAALVTAVVLLSILIAGFFMLILPDDDHDDGGREEYSMPTAKELYLETKRFNEEWESLQWMDKNGLL